LKKQAIEKLEYAHDIGKEKIEELKNKGKTTDASVEGVKNVNLIPIAHVYETKENKNLPVYEELWVVIAEPENKNQSTSSKIPEVK